MKTLYTMHLALVVIVCSCAHQGSLSGPAPVPIEQRESDIRLLLSKIKVGMSFAEVSKILPLSVTNAVMTTHGGTQYDLPAFGSYTLSLRFQRTDQMRWPTNVSETLLNHEPVLRDRVTARIIPPK